MLTHSSRILLAIGAALLLITIYLLFEPAASDSPRRSIPYSEFVGQLDSGRVADVVISGSRLRLTLQDGRSLETYMPRDVALTARLLEKKVRVEVEPPESEQSSGLSVFVAWLPSILFIVIWGWSLRRLNRSATAIAAAVQDLSRALSQDPPRGGSSQTSNSD